MEIKRVPTTSMSLVEKGLGFIPRQKDDVLARKHLRIHPTKVTRFGNARHIARFLPKPRSAATTKFSYSRRMQEGE
jgi:hypothetical protein